jgi:hypothetical protein
MRKTAWLYYGNRVLTAILSEEKISDCEVRQIALEKHEKSPLVGSNIPSNIPFEAPFEFRNKLREAEIRWS